MASIIDEHTRLVLGDIVEASITCAGLVAIREALALEHSDPDISRMDKAPN